MIIDLSEVTGDEAVEILRSEIERLGLDINSARLVVDGVDGVDLEKLTHGVTFTFNFERDQERAK